ncbi:DAGAT-domain-containing protein [Sistotremastrum niveocremeum HHB9708]|uniref:Diacylglycerol O-acyltransferase n=2 Tax=Sistotremastraceae TaxID=3402574 RepID=A0A164VV61_9AGAM|nr:DAGAT-domain-containing protein [Sistotremastrum niveocremeum HHB9708]KZT43164.1 diacylglycerol acyltransferase [Sistotremastrum suecicum HHB10207 ss-3]
MASDTNAASDGLKANSHNSALSNRSRSSSSSSLKDRFSTAFTSLRPSTILQANIDFVPRTVPRRRRLQTAAVATWALMMPITVATFFLLCSIPLLWPLIIMYLVWMSFDYAPEHGGRFNPWFRQMRCWRYFADYYPATLKKEADLPPDRPYVFGYHPHGIIGMGAFATFATESTGFSSQFPGIVPHLLTLASNFNIPIYRDILLHLGVCSVSKKSCSNILKKGPGSAICIVVGGAAESLSAHPGTADLTLRKRLGFLKLAIRHGADLVPVFSFGENDIYSQMPNERGTWVYSLQKQFQKMFGFTLPLFHGRGLLNYNFGLMPYRRSIVIVVGKPIRVKQRDDPSIDDIHETQKLYIAELTRIWDTYKDLFAQHRKRELKIID